MLRLIFCFLLEILGCPACMQEDDVHNHIPTLFFVFVRDPEVHTPCQSLVDYGNAQITRILISVKQQRPLSMSANI